MNAKSLAIIGIVAVVAIAAIAIGYSLTNNDNHDEVTDGVNYYGNGGTYDGKDVYGISSHTVSENLFKKEGATFESWNTKADGSGKTYMPGDKIDYDKSVRLYAIWYEGGYLRCSGVADNITLTCNGQTLTLLDAIKLPAGGEVTVTITYSTAQGKIFLYGDNTLEQRIINGDLVNVVRNTISASGATESTLSTDGTSGTLKITYSGSGDVIVGANNVSSHSMGKGVTYMGNGGTFGDKTKYVIDSFSVSANKFACEGKTFVSWNTAKDGSGTTYKPGDTIDYYGYVVLYAQWA